MEADELLSARVILLVAVDDARDSDLRGGVASDGREGRLGEGANEDELTAQGIPYETGIARYREIARGRLLGDENGMLKVLFHRQTEAVLGVHIIGEYATELVHIGQAVIALKGGLSYLRDAVFNYPTLAECYKVAALDGYNKLRA